MCAAICLIATLVQAGGEVPAPAEAKLTAEQVRAGWVKLFDGAAAFGWRAETAQGVSMVLEARAGELPLAHPDLAPRLTYAGPLARRGRVALDLAGAATVTTPDGKAHEVPPGPGELAWTVPADKPPVPLAFTAGTNPFALKFCHFRPLDLAPLFDGKTLAGWEFYTADPKRNLSTAEVTPAGELHLKSGPGDLQSKETYADFCLQLDAKTNAPNLNSGVFFRCLAGQYQQGYEVQIQNAHAPNDPTKPTDFGTGAIYRRVPARRVVSKDGEYFTLTVIAVGDRISTWVDGEPVVMWRDERPENANARQGKKLGAGHISLQGHDPTTGLLFRALRISRE